MQFDLPKEKSSIIKVIGVGGGGSNAVNHMYKQGIKDVDFIVCNTDRQVLDASPVPLKIQLGAALTEGLGAGSLPEMGRKAALENEQELRNALAKTKMLFITAGMGGGTGTGAAPVIAKIAREMGILTVSICTLPFSWEGKLRKKQAEDGLAELKKYSDSVLVILNDKIREIYHNLKVGEAFAHADNVLTSAAKCIAELINVALTINVDFNDVRRVMENSGVAIMGSALAAGEGRSLKAVTQALNSPLLNDNDIRGARYVLVSITCGTGKDELTMDELAEITDYVQEAAGQTAEMIKGYGTNEILGDKVSVTIIASGFARNASDLGFETPQPPEIIMIPLEDAKTETQKSATVMQKVEVSKMTEPMLKTEVIADLQPEQAGKKETEIKKESLSVAEIKKEEILIELKKVEEKPVAIKYSPLPSIEQKEVKPEPIVIKEEPKTEPVAEVTPHVVETNPDIQVPPTAESKNETEDEQLPPPFLIVKEDEQKSFEFDLTPDNKPLTDVTHTINQETKKDEVPEVSAKTEQNTSPTPKKTEIVIPAVNPIGQLSNGVNMDIKRTFTANQSGETSSESKVTKIADVTLNSQPPISDSEAKAKAQEKIQKLRELSFKVKTPGGLAELENEPAYKRKNVVLNDTPVSSESEISRLTLGAENKTPSLRPDNSFLHDKPD